MITKNINLINLFLQIFTANVVICGGGALHSPVVPDFKGKESFKGEAFHSAEWRRDYDPTGKRVAVIGTGATSVQIVPNIASKVLFQFLLMLPILIFHLKI